MYPPTFLRIPPCSTAVATFYLPATQHLRGPVQAFTLQIPTYSCLLGTSAWKAAHLLRLKVSQTWLLILLVPAKPTTAADYFILDSNSIFKVPDHQVILEFSSSSSCLSIRKSCSLSLISVWNLITSTASSPSKPLPSVLWTSAAASWLSLLSPLHLFPPRKPGYPFQRIISHCFSSIPKSACHTCSLPKQPVQPASILSAISAAALYCSISKWQTPLKISSGIDWG